MQSSSLASLVSRERRPLYNVIASALRAVTWSCTRRMEGEALIELSRILLVGGMERERVLHRVYIHRLEVATADGSEWEIYSFAWGEARTFDYSNS
jgi:hypothetical protein